MSTSDIEGLQNQLSDVQRQLLQLQKQAPSKEEVSNLEAQVGKQMESLLKSEADMQVRLQDLSKQIDQLQANLEDTNYRLAQLSQQIAATNQELKSVRAAPAPAAEGDEPGAGTAAAAGAPPANPQTLYQTAYNDYLRGNYDLAIREFQDYFDHFPDTDLADNAVYWIGECYYRQGKFRQAISQFDTVVSRYPRSDKLPSALLKKGYSHLQLGERSQGVVQLQHVIAEYPSSDEANLARQRLRSWGLSPADERAKVSTPGRGEPRLVFLCPTANERNMANTKSAAKRHRQSVERRARNRAQRSRMRSAIKELRVRRRAGRGRSEPQELLGPTLKLVDRTRQQGRHPRQHRRPHQVPAVQGRRLPSG